MRLLLLSLMWILAPVLIIFLGFSVTEMWRVNLGSYFYQPWFLLTLVLIAGPMGFPLRVIRGTKRRLWIALALLVVSSGLTYALNRAWLTRSELRTVVVVGKGLLGPFGRHRNWDVERSAKPYIQVPSVLNPDRLISAPVDMAMWKRVRVGSTVRVQTQIGITGVEFANHAMLEQPAPPTGR